MNWEIPEAQQQFSELVKAALTEPQPIYKRNQLMAFMVEAGLFQEFLEWQRQKQKPSVAEAFEDIRQVAQEENFTLEVPTRENRTNPFLDSDVSI